MPLITSRYCPSSSCTGPTACPSYAPITEKLSTRPVQLGNVVVVVAAWWQCPSSPQIGKSFEQQNVPQSTGSPAGQQSPLGSQIGKSEGQQSPLPQSTGYPTGQSFAAST